LLSALRNRKDLKFVTATDLPPAAMPQWYRSIDVYVCASRLEGTPLPVLEAMSAERVVLSTSVGVVPEITSPGVRVFDGSVHGLQATVADVMRRPCGMGRTRKVNRLYVMSWIPGLPPSQQRGCARCCAADVYALRDVQVPWLSGTGTTSYSSPALPPSASRHSQRNAGHHAGFS
jgi:glycosyltransferase involved in cell wall biosynthesis